MRKSDDLKAEYLLLQSQYEAFDQRALSLKAMATPLLGAGLVIGLQQKSILVISASIAVAFSLWLLEAIWKGFQYSFIARICLIESWFRDEERSSGPFERVEEPPFQIFTAWMESYRLHSSARNIARRMMSPFVSLPYAVVILVGIAAFVVINIEPATSNTRIEISIRY